MSTATSLTDIVVFIAYSIIFAGFLIGWYAIFRAMFTGKSEVDRILNTSDEDAIRSDFEAVLGKWDK